MSDNRARPCIHRCDKRRDAIIRAFAKKRKIAPWQALELLIDGASSWDDIARLSAEKEWLTKERDDAQTERECLATERDGAANALDEEIERSDKTTKRAYTLAERIGFVIDGLHKEAERADTAEDDLAAARKIAADLRAELASAREATRRADERIAELETAPRLPPELDRRVKACIAAAPNARPPRDFLFVVRNGCDRIEISDRYRKK